MLSIPSIPTGFTFSCPVHECNWTHEVEDPHHPDVEPVLMEHAQGHDPQEYLESIWQRDQRIASLERQLNSLHAETDKLAWIDQCR